MPGPARQGGGADLQIPEVEEGKFNVAMVLIGPHDDGGWSQAHYEGLQYLCENVPDTHVAYIENVPEGADSEQVFRSLARKGFDFIIGTSFGYMDPMETVAEEFPDQTFLHLTGYKSNGKNFGNFFGAIEDMKYLAGMLAGLARQGRRQPEDRLHGDLPDPRGAPPRQRDHARRQGDLPRVHDGRARSSTPGTTRSRRRDGAASLFDAGAQVVFTGADTPAVADVAQEKGKWGVTYDHPGSCKVDACLTAPYWIWGPEYARIAEQVKAKTYKAGYEYFDADSKAMGLFGFMDGETPQQGVARPAGRGRPEGQGHPGQDAGRQFGRFDVFAGPIKDNTGKELLPAGAEARAVRPRPVPARRPRRGVQDVHVLVERGHHRRAAAARRRRTTAGGGRDRVRRPHPRVARA